MASRKLYIDLDLQSNSRILNLPTPTLSGHAVNKSFVDNYNLVITGDVSIDGSLDTPLASTVNWVNGQSTYDSRYTQLSLAGVANGYATLNGSGLIPSSQLPSFVDDVLEYSNLASFPSTGETGKIYVALNTNYTYRWSGSIYVKLTDDNAVWGNISGTLSSQTDLQSALDLKVPTSRTITINGTTYDLSANRSWTISAGLTNPMNAVGDMIIGDTGGSPIRLPIGTSNYFLKVVGGSPAYFNLYGSANSWTANQTFTASLILSGNQNTSALSVNGIDIQIAASTITDTGTAASGTVALGMISSMGVTTIAATNTGVVYTDVATLYLAAPTAGTNVTLTNSWALYLVDPIAVRKSLSNVLYGVDIKNTGTGTLYSNVGAGVKYTHGIVIGLSYATNSSSASTQDRSIYNESSYSWVWQSNGKNGNSTANYIWLLEGAQQYMSLIKNSSTPHVTFALYNANAGSGAVKFVMSNGGVESYFYANAGRTGVNMTAPLSKLHLPAGTATANTAPLQFTFTSAAVETTARAGVMESSTSNLYFTQGGGVRYSLGSGAIFDHYADVGNTTTTETDLYSDTLPANTFNVNGDKVYARYAGTFVGNINTKTLRVYLAGTKVFDSGMLSVASAANWDIDVLAIRVSSTVVRVSVRLNSSFGTLMASSNYTAITGLTLSGANIIKITGQSSSATNDVVASLGIVEFKGAI